MKPGHNSAADPDKLKKFVEQIEALNAEKASLQTDISEIFSAAKDSGFDTKLMREIIKERKLTQHERETREEILDLYRHALGMLADTPLGEAAIGKKMAAG